MTVPVQNPIISYVGNGVTTQFSFPFAILEAADLVVLLNGGAQTAGAQFTINGIGNASGGSALFLTAPAVGDKLIIYRDISIERDTDYQDDGDLLATTVNADFDRLWMALQDRASAESRAVRYPISEYTTDGTLPEAGTRARMLLGWDDNGGQIMVPLPASVGAGDLRNEEWTDGVDYISGTSNSVTLSRAYGTKANLGAVVMAGIGQAPSSYSLSGTTLQFDAVIPLGTPKIWCTGGTTLSIDPHTDDTDVANVVSFGADPLGLVDSTAAFLAAKATGKRVTAPAGTFITGQIVWPSGSRFEGAGEATIIKPIPGFSTNAFWVTAAGAYAIELQKFRMDLPVDTYPNTVPIYALSGARNRFRDIAMPIGGGSIGILLDNNVDAVVENVTIKECNVFGFRVQGTSSARCSLNQCRILGTRLNHGISVQGGSSHRVDYCVSDMAAAFGISFFQTVNGGASHNRSGNSILEAMQISDCSGVNFDNNDCLWDNGITRSTDLGISVASQTAGYVTLNNKVRGNFISGNGASGIGVASSQLPDPGTGHGLPVQYTEISGNTIINSCQKGDNPAQGGGCGIILWGDGVVNSLVAGNIFFNNQGHMQYGILETATPGPYGFPGNNKYADNRVDGATIQAVSIGTQSIQSGCQPATAGLQGLEGWTPVVSAAAGALGSATVSSALYYETEKRVDFWFVATIAANGTGATAVNFTLPFTAVAGMANGQESALNGKALVGAISGNVCSVTNYDHTYPGANGAVIKVQGTFFRA